MVVYVAVAAAMALIEVALFTIGGGYATAVAIGIAGPLAAALLVPAALGGLLASRLPLDGRGSRLLIGSGLAAFAMAFTRATLGEAVLRAASSGPPDAHYDATPIVVVLTIASGAALFTATWLAGMLQRDRVSGGEERSG